MVRPWIRSRNEYQNDRVVVRRVFPAQVDSDRLQPEDAQVLIERARQAGEGQPVGQLRIRRRTLLL